MYCQFHLYPYEMQTNLDTLFEGSFANQSGKLVNQWVTSLCLNHTK